MTRRVVDNGEDIDAEEAWVRQEMREWKQIARDCRALRRPESEWRDDVLSALAKLAYMLQLCRRLRLQRMLDARSGR